MISTIQTERVAAIERRRSSQVSWGAIFAGWLLGFAFMLLFQNLGSAIGFTAVDVANPVESARALGIGAVAWMFVTWAASLFLGGLFAGWLAGNLERFTGAVHGMCVWAMAVVITLFLGVLGATAAVRTTQAAAGGIAEQTQQAGQGAQEGGAIGSIVGAAQDQMKEGLAGAIAAASNGQLSEAEAQQAVDRIDAATLTTVSGQLMRGETEQAERTLSTGAGLSPREVDATLAGIRSRAQASKDDIGRVAETTKNVSAGALWVAFLSSAIGLAAAAAGGAAGSNRRASSTARFENA